MDFALLRVTPTPTLFLIDKIKLDSYQFYIEKIDGPYKINDQNPKKPPTATCSFQQKKLIINPVAVVVFYFCFHFITEKCFFSIVNSFVRKKVYFKRLYLLTVQKLYYSSIVLPCFNLIYNLYSFSKNTYLSTTQMTMA